jgi:hypothetical protein
MTYRTRPSNCVLRGRATRRRDYGAVLRREQALDPASAGRTIDLTHGQLDARADAVPKHQQAGGSRRAAASPDVLQLLSQELRRSEVSLQTTRWWLRTVRAIAAGIGALTVAIFGVEYEYRRFPQPSEVVVEVVVRCDSALTALEGDDSAPVDNAAEQPEDTVDTAKSE